MTSYLVTGAFGMLGTDLVRALEGRDVRAAGRDELDVTDSAAALEAVAGYDVVLNAAAWTKVDDAEAHEAGAAAVNVDAVGNLARACAAHGAILVQYSTDYVFAGTGTTPYPEDAVIAPQSAYGRTKAAGERVALLDNPARTHVIRTAWLYGASGSSFPRTMLDLAQTKPTIDVVDDQVGAPTWSHDLAEATVALLDAGVPPRIWHWTNAGQTSWYDLARAVFENAGLDPARIRPASSRDSARAAPRPAYSVLGMEAWSAAGLPAPRTWQKALEAAMDADTFD